MEVREPTFEVAIGFRGVGKTFTLNQIVDDYIKDLQRPVLVFDVNNEYRNDNKLPGYKAIDFDVTEPNEYKRSEQIRNITAPGKYRILPFKKNRQPMTQNEMLLTASTIVTYYRNGMMVLEDLNKYTSSYFKQEFVGMFVGLRHLGVDLVAHFQSMGALPPKIWRAIEYLRWHKCAEPISQYKKHVTNLELFLIAEAIVNYKYRSNHYFFLWVDVLQNKIKGITPEDINEGCRAYLSAYPGELSRLMNHIDLEGNKKYKTRLEAINEYIREKTEEYYQV
jgi:hypothetical protein